MYLNSCNYIRAKKKVNMKNFYELLFTEIVWGWVAKANEKQGKV